MSSPSHDSPRSAIVVVTTAFICLFAGFFVGSSSIHPTTSARGWGPAGGFDSAVVPIGESPSMGRDDAPLTAVLFLDLNEPESRDAIARVEALNRDPRFEDSLRIVLKYLPENANDPLTRLALAAQREGRFHAFYRELATLQGEPTPEQVNGLAARLELRPIGGEATEEEVAVLTADANTAMQASVRRTPVIVVNGLRLTPEQFGIDGNGPETLDRELREVTAAGSLGVPRSLLYAARTSSNMRPQRTGAVRLGDEEARVVEGARPVPERVEPPAGQPAPGPEPERFAVPLGEAPARGAEDALVTIVEFSDYECPFCRRVEPTLEQLLERYEGSIRLVYRQNPLPMHPAAPLLADAALAAGEQGKYWEMHSLLNGAPSNPDRAVVEGFAQQIGLNMGRFRAFLDSERGEAIVREDQALATTLQANGTPHFFINGIRLVGAQPVDEFARVIDAELARARALVEAGTAPGGVYAALTANGLREARPPQEEVQTVTPPAVGDSPRLGPDSAPVRIFEFSDFQCPFCSRAANIPQQLRERFGDRVQIVFKQYPLPFHNNADLAAQASLEAHAQGRFWEYAELLFQNQQALDRPNLEAYAQQLGLDMARFRAALDNGTHAQTVRDEMSQGTNAGVNGTPTFVVGNRLVVGAQPIEAFATAVEAQLP